MAAATTMALILYKARLCQGLHQHYLLNHSTKLGASSVSLPKCISVTIFISELKFSIRASKDLTELR